MDIFSKKRMTEHLVNFVVFYRMGIEYLQEYACNARIDLSNYEHTQNFIKIVRVVQSKFLEIYVKD